MFPVERTPHAKRAAQVRRTMAEMYEDPKEKEKILKIIDDMGKIEKIISELVRGSKMDFNNSQADTTRGQPTCDV